MFVLWVCIVYLCIKIITTKHTHVCMYTEFISFIARDRALYVTSHQHNTIDSIIFGVTFLSSSFSLRVSFDLIVLCLHSAYCVYERREYNYLTLTCYSSTIYMHVYTKQSLLFSAAAGQPCICVCELLRVVCVIQRRWLCVCVCGRCVFEKVILKLELSCQNKLNMYALSISPPFGSFTFLLSLSLSLVLSIR